MEQSIFPLFILIYVIMIRRAIFIVCSMIIPILLYLLENIKSKPLMKPLATCSMYESVFENQYDK